MSRSASGGGTVPMRQSGDSNAAGGTYIALIFDQHVPVISSIEVKKLLAPVLDFDKHSATENYVDRLPEPVQKAIKSNKVIEGMDRDEVLLAMGKPRHKERGLQDGVETEDWVYGFPPGKIRNGVEPAARPQAGAGLAPCSRGLAARTGGRGAVRRVRSCSAVAVRGFPGDDKDSRRTVSG